MFLSAVNAVVASPLPRFTSELCPDQYVGILSEMAPKAPDFPVRRNVTERPMDQPCVLLILESPHLREFIGAPGPAKGPTGRLIRTHLPSALASQVTPAHGLILVNAVQNQCSLGCPPKEHRDAVFLSAWYRYARATFVQRLGAVLREEDYVLNACTKGGGRLRQPELRQLVEAAIREVRREGSNRRMCHPSSWAGHLASTWQRADA